MERVTFQRDDVKELLSTMVCMKIDAGGEDPPDLAKKFGVSAFPTLVLLGPTGDVIYKDAGAPRPKDFTIFFAYDSYKAAIHTSNLGHYDQAAKHVFLVTKWFGSTELGKELRKTHERLKTNEKYAAAYAKVQKEHEDKLAKVRGAAERRRQATIAQLREQQRRARIENERRLTAKKAMAEADALYKKYMRTAAFKAYREIILEYPDLPEADRARSILRRHKKKWKEPTGN